MCGRLDGSVLEVWGERLRELKYLSLYGSSLLSMYFAINVEKHSLLSLTGTAPYLVTPAQWKAYFGTFKDDRQLEGFGLIQSARELSYRELLISPHRAANGVIS